MSDQVPRLEVPRPADQLGLGLTVRDPDHLQLVRIRVRLALEDPLDPDAAGTTAGVLDLLDLEAVEAHHVDELVEGQIADINERTQP